MTMINSILFSLAAVQTSVAEPACELSDKECEDAKAIRLFYEWQSMDRQQRGSERLGPGPHTLVISGPNGFTRIEYKTGAKCQRARDEVRRQDGGGSPSPGVYRVPSLTAVCVPR